MSKIYKNNGVKYWKDCFSDLKVLDTLHLDNILTRFKNTLYTFDNFKEDNGWFFIPIKRESDLDEVLELKRLHEKFNSKSVIFPDENGNPRRICFHTYGYSPYKRDYYRKGTLTMNSHQNWKDGMIRPGLNMSAESWKGVTKNIEKGILSDKFVYIEIPYDIILDYMVINHNGHEMKIPKQFVEEVEDTKNGWKNDDTVNELIDLYDKKYPDWNYDFPTFGYTSFVKYGLLMPTFYFGNKVFKNGTHRLYNACLSKSDIPLFINMPSQNPDPKFKRFVVDENEFIVYSVRLFRKINNEYSRLLMYINLNDRSLKFYLTTFDVYEVENGLIEDKEYIGESKF